MRSCLVLLDVWETCAVRPSDRDIKSLASQPAPPRPRSDVVRRVCFSFDYELAGLPSSRYLNVRQRPRRRSDRRPPKRRRSRQRTLERIAWTDRIVSGAPLVRPSRRLGNIPVRTVRPRTGRQTRRVRSLARRRAASGSAPAPTQTYPPPALRAGSSTASGRHPSRRHWCVPEFADERTRGRQEAQRHLARGVRTRGAGHRRRSLELQLAIVSDRDMHSLTWARNREQSTGWAKRRRGRSTGATTKKSPR